MSSALRSASRHASRAQRLIPSSVTSLTPCTPVRCYHSTRATQHVQGATSSWRMNQRMVGTENSLRIANRNLWRKVSSTPRLRGFHASAVSRHMGIDRPAPGTGIKVHFENSDGTPIKTCEANEGDNILAIAHEYDIDLEGACEGSVACSTCHVILDPEIYDILPEPEDDENDMLDMAFGLTDTSRLGCQVNVTKEMDGMKCRLPAATRNMFVDGKKSSH